MWEHLSEAAFADRVKKLQKLAKRKRDGSWALDLLGAIEAKSGRMPEALEYWRRSFESDNDALFDIGYQLSAAAHPDTPRKQLELRLGASEEVRELLARNCALPRDIFERVARDESSEVRWGVASNPMCPDDLLEQLASDPHVSVRIAVARNWCTPPKLIANLLADSDERVRNFAKEHPDAS